MKLRNRIFLSAAPIVILFAATSWAAEKGGMVELGRALYFDKRLSADNTVSCATCHAPEHGFTDNKPVSNGIGGQKGGRSAPTVINRLYSAAQFWDGRAASLEEQAKGPIVNPIEMGMASHDALVAKLKAIKGYDTWFKKAFGREINIDDIAKAIANFERTVVSDDSKYDRYVAGNKKAMNASEKRGMDLFNGKARCITCHGGNNFTDESFHNLGVGMDAEKPDLGRYSQTGKDEDKGAFKTPTLRDVASTAPYMHDGSETTLEQVVAFYNGGGNPNDNLDSLMDKLNLSADEEKDLVAFLKGLSGKKWRSISPPKKFPQ